MRSHFIKPNHKVTAMEVGAACQKVTALEVGAACQMTDVSQSTKNECGTVNKLAANKINGM